MPRGDKSSYSNKQKRQAGHIEKGYRSRGDSPKSAARKAWSTVNAESGGGNKSGSGRGRSSSTTSSKRGGQSGGRSQSYSERSRAAKKGWETRRRNGNA